MQTVKWLIEFYNAGSIGLTKILYFFSFDIEKEVFFFSIDDS